MVGTNTLKVLNRSDVPVLAVKVTDKHEIPKKWLMVSDFQEESEENLNVLLKLAKNMEASVQLLYVNTPYYFAESIEIEDKWKNY